MTSGSAVYRLWPLLAPTTLALLAANFLCASGGDVLFNDVGYVAAPSSYGHITFALAREDLFDKFEQRAWLVFHHFLSTFGLDKHHATRDCTEHAHTNAERKNHACAPHALPLNESIAVTHVYAAELRDLAVKTGIITHEMAVMTFGHRSAAHHRNKRQFELLALGVIEIVEFGLTIRNAYEIEQFRRKLATIQDQVAGLIHMDEEIMRTQLRDHEMILKLLNQTIILERDAAMTKLSARFTAYKLVLTSIKEEAEAAYSALALLHQGVISPVLVNYTRLEHSFIQFKAMASKRGMSTVFATADALLASHASYWVEDGTLRIALPIAIVPEASSKPLQAYRLESEPTSVPGVNDLQVVFRSPHRYILVNEDRSYYYALTEEEWARCNRLAGRIVCTETRLRWDSWGSTCIGSLFAGLPERKTMCEVSVRKAPAFEVREVKAGLLRVQATSETAVQWRTRCFGQPEQLSVTRNGTSYIKVQEGCTIYGPLGAYSRPPNTVELVTNITLIDQHDLALPASLSTFDDWSDVRSVIDDSTIEGYVEATKLSEMRERRIMRDVQTAHTSAGTTNTLVVAAFSAVSTLAFVAGVYACTIARRRRREEREQLEMSVVPTPACSTPQMTVSVNMPPVQSPAQQTAIQQPAQQTQQARKQSSTEPTGEAGGRRKKKSSVSTEQDIRLQ